MKVDFKKTLPAFKARKNKLEIVNIPDQSYLMIDGQGSPGGETYAHALTQIYPVAYGLKFFSKLELGKDYVVPPLEGLWWADDMASFTTARDKSKWRWTTLILLPDWIDNSMVEQAKQKARAKVSDVDLIRMETLSEGQCVQTLHVGSFDNEGPILHEMHEQFIPDNDLKMTGKHHEIYFSDFRKTQPEKLRTILRQPVLPK